MRSLVIVLFQIFSWFWQWKQFENRSIWWSQGVQNGAYFWAPYITA